MHLLFAYGSLKRGFEFADHLRDEIFVAEAVLSGYRLLCFGDYPAIIKSDQAEHRVKGELYRISQQALATVDALEGGEYERISVQVEVAGGVQTALVYVASAALLHSRPFRYLDAETWAGRTLDPPEAGGGEPCAG